MNRLLIWGTGNFAKQFIENEYTGEIIGFIETDKKKESFMGKPVYDSSELPPKDKYDYIVVANSYTTEIYDTCLKLNIDMEKVIFLYAVRCKAGCTNLEIIRKILSEKNYNNYCFRFGMLDNTFVDEDALEYKRLNKRPNFAIQEQYMWPIIIDKFAYAGGITNYFFQDMWAARLIIRSGVKEHFDIGSRLDGFISHLLAADISVTMIDVREFPGMVEQLTTIVDDATSLRQVPDNSIESMSALCSLEHFGLGRYGDTIDPEACFKCFTNIQRKLKNGGKLYISLPIGKERVEFNAHRVFYPSTVVECFSTLILKEFSCVADGRIEYGVDLHKYDNDSHNGEYRYGLFQFEKILV